MLGSLIPAENDSASLFHVTINMLNNLHNLLQLLQVLAKNQNDLQVEITQAICMWPITESPTDFYTYNKGKSFR